MEKYFYNFESLYNTIVPCRKLRICGDRRARLSNGYKLTRCIHKEYYLYKKEKIHAFQKAGEITEEQVFEIRAEVVTVEVRDQVTGEVYRRELPISYYENANFLRLSGENLDGSLSQLVFYTTRGLTRMNDLTGKGPDHDDCGNHTNMKEESGN